MIGMTCSRQQHPSTSSLCQTLPTPDWYLESKPRRLLGKKKNLVPAKRKRSKLSYLNGRRVSLDDSGRPDAGDLARWVPQTCIHGALSGITGILGRARRASFNRIVTASSESRSKSCARTSAAPRRGGCSWTRPMIPALSAHCAPSRRQDGLDH